MITLNLPSILVPLVGLVFPAIAMASCSKKQDFLDPMEPHLIHSFFFQDLDLDHNTDIHLVEYGITCGFLRT